MRCYKCGATLTASDRCPQCKADVSVYKRAAKASNAYYNLGKGQGFDRCGRKLKNKCDDSQKQHRGKEPVRTCLL